VCWPRPSIPRTAPGGHPAREDPKAGAILLLAHIDVVEAKREDWVRDPFKLVEEDGYFYARGASDDKAMAAIFTDSLIRYKQEGFKPKRDLKLALTCGEEGGPFNSVPWLLENHPETLKADFALNEGDDSRLDEKGQPRLLGIQVGEKVYMDYNLSVTNPGGHSSRPIKDNAIYHLAGGLSRLGAYDFPIALNDATKGYFEQSAKIEPDAEVAGGHARHGQGPDRRRGRRHPGPRPRPQQHDAHHLRGHHGRGRPCAQRPAAARQGQRQLPHPAGQRSQDHPRPAGDDRRRSRRSRSPWPPIPTRSARRRP
jgi:hypothetical protein